MKPNSSTPDGTPRRKFSATKIIGIVVLSLAVMVVIAAVVIVVKRDDILNAYIKPQLEHGVASSQEGSMLSLSDLHYHIWQNCVMCDSGNMSIRDAATKVQYELRIKGMKYSFWGNTMICDSVSYGASDSSTACTIDTVIVEGFAPRRLMDGDSIVTHLLNEMHIQLHGVALSQPKLHTALQCARMSVSPGDSLLFAEGLTETDSSRQCSMGSVTLHGVDWTKLFGSNLLITAVCAHSIMDATDIAILYPGSQYAFQCSRVHVSFPASALTADSVQIQPVDGDATFFEDSKFRKTRIRFDAPQCSMEGADLCGLLVGTAYAARYVQFQSPHIEILINKEKPSNMHDPAPRMPDQILSQQTAAIRFDSVQVLNGSVMYQERYTAGSQPAKLAIDSMEVMVNGFGNARDPADTARIAVQARLQGSTFFVHLMLPLAGAGLSAHCTGSMKHTDLTSLNPWLEKEDALRVKAGTLQEATFEMNINHGKSAGNIRAIYRDFSVAMINEKTKSEGGIFNKIGSFIANTFKLRGSNVPDGKGKVKLATIKYVHKSEEPFFQFAWYSLRSGLKDLIGF